MSDEQLVGRDNNDATDHGNHDALDVEAGHVSDLEDGASQVATDDSPDDAQDVVQESFLSAYQALENFKGDAGNFDGSAVPTIDETIAIGKIGDIYAHHGTKREIKADGNEALNKRFARCWVPLSARSGGVLNVANALLGATFDLLGLAFGLLRVIAGRLAETLFDFAGGLVDGAFGAHTGHVDTPLAMPAT